MASGAKAMAAQPFLNILTMTLWTTVFTTVGVMAFGAIERRAPFLPANAISHMFYGDEAFSVDEPTPKYSLPGLLLNLAAMFSWACIAELLHFVLRTLPGEIVSTTIVSVLTTLLAFVVDFHVVPKRFTPGFERVISRGALYAVYATLAIAFFLSGLQRT